MVDSDILYHPYIDKEEYFIRGVKDNSNLIDKKDKSKFKLYKYFLPAASASIFAAITMLSALILSYRSE